MLKIFLISSIHFSIAWIFNWFDGPDDDELSFLSDFGIYLEERNVIWYDCDVNVVLARYNKRLKCESIGQVEDITFEREFEETVEVIPERWIVGNDDKDENIYNND